MTTEIRFITYTDSTAGPLLCWPWTGATNENGYGVLHEKGRLVRATHVALRLAGHERPPEAKALHDCDNPPCVNPTHLYWGTQKDNVADMHNRGRGNTGERNGQAKLSSEIAEAIRWDRTTKGLSYLELSETYGVSVSTISRVITRQVWNT